jgi:predicted metalloprotease with PDZ domain
VKGVAHRIVIDGDGNYDPEKMRGDVRKVVEAEVELMGGEIPYHDYTFILHLRSSGGGGLEHLNSTALGFRRFGFKPEASYRDFWALVAHEFFHLWNVKRIKPDALGPFDYTKENYTKLLWVAEGITDYYTKVALRRAGLISDREFLIEVARQFQNLQNTPGRLEMSAEDASFDSWIKYYRQDENSINSQVDYYSKGAILGLLLDLEIRKRSNGAKSLDDVMRYLYTDYYKKGRNYTPEDFQKVCELMAGSSLEQFFTMYVRGREELDYNAALAAAGLQLDTKGAAEDSKSQPNAYLGADLAQENNRLMVRHVIAGGPAYEQGLNAGDEIIAVNNVRANKDFLDARLAEKRPGDPITLTIFRSDDLSTMLIRLGSTPDGPYRIKALDSPTEDQKRIYQAWLGAPYTK